MSAPLTVRNTSINTSFDALTNNNDCMCLLAAAPGRRNCLSRKLGRYVVGYATINA
jgi:hypothetical protein